MSKKSELLQLISSMSLQERLQFENRWAEADSNYLQLFKWLCESEMPNNKELQKRLDKTGITQPLPQIKKKLKEKISQYFVYRLLTHENQAYQNQFDYYLLKSLQARGLHNTVAKRAEKLQQSAMATGDIHLTIMALELDMYQKRDDVLLINEELVKYNKLIDLYHLQGQVKMAVYSLNNYRRQYLFVFNAPAEWDELMATLPATVTESQATPENLHLGILLLNAQWLYHISRFNKQATYACSNKMREWVDKYYEQLEKHPVTPMLFSFKMMAAIELNDHKMLYHDLPRVLSNTAEMNQSYAEWPHLGEFKLPGLLVNNQLEMLPDMLAEQHAYFKKMNLPVPQSEHTYRLLHITEDYLEAKNELTNLIDQVYKVQRNLINESYARIYELLLLADMGSVAVIPSRVEAYRKWLRRKLPNTPNDGAEQLVIRYFPKLYDVNGKLVRSVARKFLDSLLSFPNQQHPVLHHFYGGLIPWLQAKLDDRPYREVVMEIVQQNIHENTKATP